MSMRGSYVDSYEIVMDVVCTVCEDFVTAEVFVDDNGDGWFVCPECDSDGTIYDIDNYLRDEE